MTEHREGSRWPWRRVFVTLKAAKAYARKQEARARGEHFIEPTDSGGVEVPRQAPASWVDDL